MTYILLDSQGGGTKPGALQHVAREAYQALLTPEPTTNIADLRARGQALGLPMRAAAEHFMPPIKAIARLELSEVRDVELATRYHAWLHTHGAA